ncbi:MAG: multidrug efflux RND transporter permease subunit [bacterium]|nr:multidrug efflux RND transporter permease subunit [bacterium]
MISQFFISRPKFAFVISIVIVIAGLIAIKSLPVAQYPQIVPPQVSITTTYPGASAKTVEETVITPIEQQLNGVEKMIYFTSKSANDGSATITVSFEIGSDPNMNTVNTQNRVAIATPSLPEEVKRQGITVKQQSSEMLLIINVYSDNPKLDGVYLSNFCSLNILDEITRIPGVGQANILGAQEYAMRIWLDPNKLTSLKMSTEEVINAIQQQNIQVASGQIGGAPSKKGQQFQYTIQTLGRLSSVKEFENIIIRESSSGAKVRIKDVAKVELGSFSYSAYGQLNGKPSALLAVYQLPDANALDVGNKVKAKLAELKKSFPKNIDTNVLYDTTKFVSASISEVVETLVIAVLLVIFVTYIFLQDWRSTLIPTVAIPVSLIGTFAVLLALGYSINLITLFGLILAIGIVVDDAIVVIENVNRIMEEEGLPPKEATSKSMKQVTAPIIATTLVLLATFIPVAFLPGITGVLYRQFAVTISVSVLISSVNALTLSPALCATILKSGKKNIPLPFVWFNKFFDSLTDKYNRCVSFLIRRVSLIVIFFILLLVFSYIIYGSLPTGFIPNEDQGAFIVNVQLPDGASLDRTGKTMSKLTTILQNTNGVKNVMSVTGFSMLTGTTSSNVGMAIAVLKDWSERTTPDLQIDTILKKLNRKFYSMPSAEIMAFSLPPIPGLGTSGGFEFELQEKGAGNPQKMASVLNDIIYKANHSPVFAQAYSTYRANVPQLYLNINREKAMKLGIPLPNIFNALQTYLGSTYVNDFNKFGKTYKVMLQAQPDYRNKTEDIYNLYVINKDNDMVPLRTLLSVKTILGPDVISHYNMLTSAEINGSAAPGYSSGQAIKTMEEIANETMPEGMTYSWTGTAYQEILAGNMVLIIFALAITFIYLFLVAQYESWLIALAVMLSVPVAFFGALAAMWVVGITNNIYAQVGFALLFGMASKTAILIVEFAKEQRESGKPILESAEFAASLRFRAVIMTAVSFILGVLPLVIATGPSAASRRSLGTAVFGGMLLAAVLGTLVIPAFYVIIQKIIEYESAGKKKKNQL